MLEEDDDDDESLTKKEKAAKAAALAEAQEKMAALKDVPKSKWFILSNLVNLFSISIHSEHIPFIRKSYVQRNNKHYSNIN